MSTPAQEVAAKPRKPKRKAVRLTLREEEFVKEYARNGFNGTQAMLKTSGGNITPTTAAQSASLALKNPNILARVHSELDRKDSMYGLETVSEGHRKLMTQAELTGNLAAMNTSLSTRQRLWEKLIPQQVESTTTRTSLIGVLSSVVTDYRRRAIDVTLSAPALAAPAPAETTWPPLVEDE